MNRFDVYYSTGQVESVWAKSYTFDTFRHTATFDLGGRHLFLTCVEAVVMVME